MYRAYGLLPSPTDFSTAEIIARMKPLLPNYIFSHTDDQAVANKGEWQFRFWINSDPIVATESAGMVATLAGLEPADIAVAEACRMRVEVWSDDSDPFIDHLADFQTIVGVLKTFPGVIALDPKEPALF